MQSNPIIILVFILLFPFVLSAQTLGDGVYVTVEEETLVADTTTVDNVILHTTTETIIVTDTIISESTVIPTDSDSIEEAFRPNANRAIWLGAVIPGYGQIVNKKYWKLPFIYGGYMGCAFAITWFSNEYQFYKIAYRDIIDDDPTTNSYLKPIPDGMTIQQIYGSEAAYRDRLKSGMDNYRRYRDLSILLTVIYYGLTILEAYVDAQLYDFDISPDLSMRFQPAIINNDIGYAKLPNEYDAFGKNKGLGSGNAVGIQWNIRLK